MKKSNNANHKLVPYMDFIQNYLAPKHWNSEEFKQDYALHLADVETKRDKMSEYLRDRSQNIIDILPRLKNVGFLAQT